MAIAVHPKTWIERRRARRDADYWIGHGFESRYPWRVAELTSDAERRACARSLRSVIGEVRGEKLPGATPLRRASLRPHLARLEALEARLGDGDSGVGRRHARSQRSPDEPRQLLLRRGRLGRAVASPSARAAADALMYDLAALAIAAACFAFIFVLVYVLERI